MAKKKPAKEAVKTPLVRKTKQSKGKGKGKK